MFESAIVFVVIDFVKEPVSLDNDSVSVVIKCIKVTVLLVFVGVIELLLVGASDVELLLVSTGVVELLLVGASEVELLLVSTGVIELLLLLVKT